MNNLRLKVLYLDVLEIAVAEDDDLIADNAFSRGRPVQTYLTRVLFAGYDIGLKPLSIIYIGDLHLLIGKHAGIF